jgi:hypothetical protein
MIFVYKFRDPTKIFRHIVHDGRRKASYLESKIV